MKQKLIIIAVLVAAIAGLAIWKWPAPAANLPAPERSADGYYVWTVQHLKAGLAQKDFTVINVHTPFEGRIAKTDLEIPYDKIGSTLEKLPQDKGAKIVLYCRSGRMSDIAAKQLAQLGYTNVASVAGGMLAWEEAGGKISDK
jgi:rhodanese-related sulfurtransferase